MGASMVMSDTLPMLGLPTETRSSRWTKYRVVSGSIG